MNGEKDLVRHAGSRFAELVEDRKRALLITAGILAAVALVFFILLSGGHREQAAAKHEDEEHHGRHDVHHGTWIGSVKPGQEFRNEMLI